MKKLNQQLNDITGGPGLLPNLFGNVLNFLSSADKLEYKIPLHQGIDGDLVRKVLGSSKLEPAKLGAPKLGRRK